MSYGKKLLSKAFTVLTGMLFTLVLAAGMIVSFDDVSVEAAKKKTSEQTEVKSTVTDKAAKKFAKKVAKANKAKALLKKHVSVYVTDIYNEIWFSKYQAYHYYNEGMATYYYNEGIATYADDNLACQMFLEEGGVSFSYLFDMITNGDKYALTEIDYMINQSAEIDNILEEEHISLVNDGNTIVYIGRFSEERDAEFKEEIGIPSDVGRIYTKITVDAKTYELIAWDSFAEGDEEELYSHRVFTYDVENPSGCEVLCGMAYRTEKKMIDVSVTVDAGTSKEYSKKMTIPANSTIIVDIQNTDGKFYMDPECTKEATWDRISDIAFYLKTVDEN